MCVGEFYTLTEGMFIVDSSLQGTLGDLPDSIKYFYFDAVSTEESN